MHAITTEHAPAAIGPYSQAVAHESFVFTSGQLGIDPSSGQMAADVTTQAERSISNIEAILNQEGLDLSNVIKTTVYLADINDFAAVNEVYGRRFPAPHPARSAFQVAALPAGGLVEIEAIAARR